MSGEHRPQQLTDVRRKSLLTCVLLCIDTSTNFAFLKINPSWIDLSPPKPLHI